VPAPYLYPAKRHKRTLAPGPFTRYQAYKPYLREEFRRQCVYCRTPDGSLRSNAFGVDHYLPQVRFGTLRTLYSNLYYCCNTCNGRKGGYYPKTVDRAAKRFIPNPCDHTMTSHVVFRADKVEALTVAGAHTVSLLMFNDDEWLKHRATTRASVRQLQEDRRVWREHLSAVRLKLTTATSTRPRLESQVARCSDKISRLNELLAGLGVA